MRMEGGEGKKERVIVNFITCDFCCPARYIIMMRNDASMYNLPIHQEKLSVECSSWKRQVGYTGVPSQKGGFRNMLLPSQTALIDRLILQGEIANPNLSSSN